MFGYYGIINKLSDNDFLNLINDYDVLLFSETWHSRVTNIHVDGYQHFRVLDLKLI